MPHAHEPWKWQAWGETIVVYSPKADKQICRINAGGNADAGVPDQADKNNAHLIVAAPELLAACHEANAYLQGALASQRSGQIDDFIIRDLLRRKICDAITKSKGGAA